jgi:putative membrane protein
MNYPGIDGFLGTRASLMLDVVFLAMFAVVPVLGWSVWLVKCRRNYSLHKRVQLMLGALLLVTVVLFEIDVRINGWVQRAESSPRYPHTVFAVLYIHLFFAVTTTGLWIAVITRALRHCPVPPTPGTHSPSHRFWGRLAAIDMTFTAVTGWVFYYVAFVSGRLALLR